MLVEEFADYSTISEWAIEYVNAIFANGLELDKFFGTRVTAYATSDKDTNTYSVIYMDYAEDYNTLEIDFRDIVDIKNGLITYVNEENVELDIDVENLSYVTENGKVLSSLGEICDYKENDGKIILTASEKKGEPDTAIVYRYNYYVASYADANQYRLGLNFRQEYNGVNYIQFGEKDIIKVTLDTTNNKIEIISAEDFTPGVDKVATYIRYGRMYFMFKNK